MKKCTYCSRLSNDTVAVCSECGTTLPSERFEATPTEVLTPTEVRTRRKAIRDGLVWIALGLAVLVMGWIYPAWFLGRDPITQRDTDLRLMNARGEAFLFCLILSFVFAVLGVRRLQRGSKASHA